MYFVANGQEREAQKIMEQERKVRWQIRSMSDNAQTNSITNQLLDKIRV